MFKNGLKYLVGVLLFIVLFTIGQQLSIRKPLWNDEIYSQVYGVDQFSYGQILASRLEEGNSAPLFYVLQKFTCRVFNYHFPGQWNPKKQWYVLDLNAQRILRINSNIYMSLCLTLIFLFFWKKYSLATATLSLAISFCSVTVWSFWAEARPYSLWMLLTALQMILLLNLLNRTKCSWIRISVVHLLLSLTTVISILQICFASVMLFVCKSKDWKKYIAATIAPIGICFFYYFSATEDIHAYLVHQPFSMIAVHFSSISLVLFAGYLCWLTTRWIQKRPRVMGNNYFSIFTSFMLLSALIVVGVYKLKEVDIPSQLNLANRTFVFLAPVEIIAVTIIFYHLMIHTQKKIWPVINVSVMIGGYLMIKYLGAFKVINELRLY